MAAERYKWHQKIQNSTLAGSEESPPESEHRVIVLGNFYTIQTSRFSYAGSPGPLPLGSSVPAYETETRTPRHEVATRLQEGWCAASKAADRHSSCLSSWRARGGGGGGGAGVVPS